MAQANNPMYAAMEPSDKKLKIKKADSTVKEIFAKAPVSTAGAGSAKIAPKKKSSK